MATEKIQVIYLLYKIKISIISISMQFFFKLLFSSVFLIFCSWLHQFNLRIFLKRANYTN